MLEPYDTIASRLIIEGEGVRLPEMIQVGDRVHDGLPFTHLVDVREGVEFERVTPGAKDDHVIPYLDVAVGVPGCRGRPHPQQMVRDRILLLCLASGEGGNEGHGGVDSPRCHLLGPRVLHGQAASIDSAWCPESKAGPLLEYIQTGRQTGPIDAFYRPAAKVSNHYLPAPHAGPRCRCLDIPWDGPARRAFSGADAASACRDLDRKVGPVSP